MDMTDKHTCDCVSSILKTYMQLEAEPNKRLKLDTLLCMIERACTSCTKFVACANCTKDTFCLAVTSAFTHRLVTAANLYGRSAKYSKASSKCHGVFLDDYQLKTAESALLVNQLLTLRVQDLSAAAIVPVRKLIDQLAGEICTDEGRNTLQACQRALGEAAEMLHGLASTLQAQLQEANDVMNID